MRSTAETIELDSSLRQSRTIYVTLAVILFPFAVAGLVYVMTAVTAIIQSISDGYFPFGAARSIFVVLVGSILAGAEVAVIAQCREANRRLRVLREQPEQKVRKLPAPFQSSLFGPYH